jgi:hypothetical protein
LGQRGPLYSKALYLTHGFKRYVGLSSIRIGNEVDRVTTAQPREEGWELAGNAEPYRTAGTVGAGEVAAGSMGFANFFTVSEPYRRAGGRAEGERKNILSG